MSVFRVEKNKGYTVMSNHHLRNHALSLKATYIRGQHGSGAAKMKADIRKKRANRHKK